MLKSKLNCAGAALVILLTGSAVNAADEPVSRDAVVLPVSIGSGQNNLVGLPFICEPVVSGAVTAVSGTTVTDSSGSFGSLSGTYSLAVTTGAARGTYADITGFSGSNITLASAVTGLKVGDAYQIVPAYSLGKIFGSTTADVTAKGIVGGASPAAADNVLAFDSAGTIRRYYFNSSAVPVLGGWREVGGGATTDVADNALLNSSGLVIIRPATAPASTLYLSGVARKGAQRIDLRQGANLYFHPNPVAVSLDDSALYSGDPATGVTGGASPATADTVRVFASDGSSKTYYYNSSAVPVLGGWREVGGSATADQGGVMISAGASVLIERGTATAGSVLSLENVTP